MRAFMHTAGRECHREYSQREPFTLLTVRADDALDRAYRFAHGFRRIRQIRRIGVKLEEPQPSGFLPTP